MYRGKAIRALKDDVRKIKGSYLENPKERTEETRTICSWKKRGREKRIASFVHPRPELGGVFREKGVAGQNK